MRKFPLLLLALMLLMLSMPAQEPASAGIIPWDAWSDFWWNVQVEPIGDSTATVKPLGQYEFHFKFWNGGVVNGDSKVPLRYYLRITNISGEGWNAYVNPTFIYLGQGESYNATVYVTADVKPSYIANITCEIAMHVKMTDFIKYNNITFQVRSQPYRWLAVDIPTPVVDGKQERTYTVPINITNNGNYDDEYLISVPYAPSRWLYALSEQRVHLFPGESAQVNLTFHIPHERFYIQYENYLMKVKIQSANDPSSYITRPIVVSLHGFHLTIGQLAAVASIMPSFVLLAALGASFYYLNNECRQIPKPWKEEELPEKNRREVKKLMREEWKSAIYFCKGEKERIKRLNYLFARKESRQRALERKILGEWKKAWVIPHQEWEKQCREIREEYEAYRRKILTMWRDANEKIKKANHNFGSSIPLIPQPEMPPLKLIPEPGKLPKPRIPKYEVDVKRMRIIEPDKLLLERILMPLKRGKSIAKMESDKIRRMGDARKEKIRLAFIALEKKMEAEIARATSKITAEKTRHQRSRALSEQRRRAEEAKKRERQRIEEEKKRLRERMMEGERRKRERAAMEREELKAGKRRSKFK